MNGLPYYPRYPRDFLEATAGWPLDLKGAYSIILDLIYLHGGELPDEPRFIAGHLGCSVRAWNLLRAQLIERDKIKADLGIISNFRADNLLEKSRTYQDNQREKARERWKTKGLADAAASPEAMPKRSHTEPEPKKKKESASHSCASVDARTADPVHKPTRFSEFWDAYPHRKGVKKGKKPAEAKYAAAVRSGVPEQAIIDGAIRARGDPSVQRGYARDPATWLNQAGWDDDIPDHDHDQPPPLFPTPGSRSEEQRNAAEERNRRIIMAAAIGTT